MSSLKVLFRCPLLDSVDALCVQELDRWLSHLKGDGDNVTSTGDNGVCVTCLGILQEGHCSTTFLDKVSLWSDVSVDTNLKCL